MSEEREDLKWLEEHSMQIGEEIILLSECLILQWIVCHTLYLHSTSIRQSGTSMVYGRGEGALRALQILTGVGYLRVTLTWGTTRLQKICTEPYVFSFFAGGSSSIVGNGSGSSRSTSAVHEQ